MAGVQTLRVPECAACSALCCRVSVIPLDPRYAWDRALIAAGKATHQAGAGQIHWVIARQASGSCQFLDESSNRCTIYARRPYVCRTWGCLSREDALKLGMSAIERGLDPLTEPPVRWLRQAAPGAYRAVRQAAMKRGVSCPAE